MRPLTQDLSIFNRINLERPPVGVKFLFFRPEGMEQLSIDENLSFCEMLKSKNMVERGELRYGRL